MKKYLSLIIFSLATAGNLFAQSEIEAKAIRMELSAIRDRDQKTRTGRDSAQFIQMIDSMNLVQVESLIAKYGWLRKSVFGTDGNNTVFLVIQHADLKTQEKYLPMFIQSVADSESYACDLALMQDRVLMRQGKKQIFGSQVVPDEATGGWKFYPIEDEKNVNTRRDSVGLEPIEKYAKFFGVEYKMPKD